MTPAYFVEKFDVWNSAIDIPVYVVNKTTNTVKIRACYRTRVNERRSIGYGETAVVPRRLIRLTPSTTRLPHRP